MRTNNASGARDLVPECRLASEVMPEEIDFVWKDYLATGAMTMIDGPPGCGKSTMLTDLVARITTGSDLPDGSSGGPPAAVVVFNAEDHPACVQVPRLKAAGADLGRVILPSAEGSVTSLDEIGRQALEKIIRVHGARMVIIDPVMSFIPGGVSTNSDSDLRSVLTPLSQMAVRTRCAVILVRHLNKDESKSAMNRGMGSIAFTGACRSVFIFGRNPAALEGDERVLAQVKSNLGKEVEALSCRIVTRGEVGAIEWGGPIDVTADEVAAGGSSSKPRDAKRQQAVGLLKDWLSSGPVATRELAGNCSAHGISVPTMRRALVTVGARNRRVGGANGHHTWELPRT